MMLTPERGQKTRDVREQALELALKKRSYFRDLASSSEAMPPFFLCVVSGYLLLWVAVFNGYPIFYYDSAMYLKASYTLRQPIFRTIGYSVFVRFVNLGSSPWLIVIAQSVIVVFVLYSAFNLMARGLAPVKHMALVFLGLMLFVSFGTTLPWFVGQIMPDVFTGVNLLSFFLLLYDPTMKLERSVLTCLVFCLSVGVHITHLLAVSVLLLVVFIFRTSSVFREFWPTRSIKGIVVLVLIPLIAVATLTALSNRRVGLGFTLSPAKDVFLFARLMESGLAPAYLQQRCQIEKLTPCKYLNNLPPTANDLLWTPTYPLLEEMGGWYGARGEARKIVSATIRYNPLGFVKECVKQMFRQFVKFAPGVENEPLQNDSSLEDFRELYPGEMPRYVLSRQSIGKLLKDGERAAPICATVFWCSLGVNLMALFARRLRTKMANQLFVLTLVFLFANAMATGALSCVVDRYQARASWLMAMCCAAYVIPFLAQWQNGGLFSARVLSTDEP
jgi:ABC-type multidrug transport system fused ATPase/permease subunit